MCQVGAVRSHLLAPVYKIKTAHGVKSNHTFSNNFLEMDYYIMLVTYLSLEVINDFPSKAILKLNRIIQYA